ncbi:MAG: hypothetical protein FWE42_09350 [Defluviitaleaceae bacterium]|nr:hypothetical protein [Defluviitaleaceae bacterium]
MQLENIATKINTFVTEGDAPGNPQAENEGLSELAAALAHEIKNPAALALAHVAQLRKREDLRGIGDACDHIEEALEQICCLVQEMLFVAYGAAPAYEFDLEDTLLDMLQVYQAAWPQINFTLETGIRPKGYMYYGEETYIKMIFSNLLKNAAEAVGYAGGIDTRLDIVDGYTIVTITDSGSRNTILRPHASGLGLAICRWLLGRNGGRLELAAAAGGCEARVLLPFM